MINLTTVDHAACTFMFINESGFFFFLLRVSQMCQREWDFRRNQSWFVYQIGKFV